MKRRTFVAGMCVLATGTGGLMGYRARSQNTAEVRFDFKAFLQDNTDVKFQFMPAELMAKLYARSLADVDRQTLVRTLVRPNAALFVVAPYERAFGTPGFYRITG